MTKKHASTLRFLDFRSAFVGIDALEMLFRCCTSLEEFYISAGPTALILFREHLPGLRYLHSASFQVCNVKRNKFRLSHEEATSTIQGGSPTFRRLAINGTKWEVVFFLLRFVLQSVVVDSIFLGPLDLHGRGQSHFCR